MNSGPHLSWRGLDLTPKKMGMVVQVSREQAIDYGYVEPTPEEVAQREALTARYVASSRAAWAEYEVTAAALEAVAEPAVRAVLDLHAPDMNTFDVTCSADVYDSEMGDHETYPCETVRAIANAYGIPLPSYPLSLRYRP